MYQEIKLFLAMIFSILLISCNGQVSKEEKLAPLHPAKTNSINKTLAKDPIFFIEGQLCQHVRKIFQDRSGNLWFGTNVYGLMKYDGDSLVYFDKTNGFDQGRITGIVEDRKGNIWLGTYKGLSKYDGHSFSHFTVEHGLLNNEIWSLTIDRQEKIWIGTNEGLSIFDGETFTTLQVPKPSVKDTNTIYSENRIVSIVEDLDGNIWLGTDGFGICKYDGKSFTHFTTEDGLCDNVIHEMKLDKKGKLWIGTYYGGLSSYNGKSFTNFTLNGTISGIEVGGFFEDSNEDLWFAVENNGVYRYRDGTFHHYYKEEGLPTNGILSIYKDKENRFWFGGWGGLFRYREKTFVSVTKNGPWKK